ncbi:MAG: bifunctional diaminohydroxyphosphoribosylaminopyrimidine deaminase/5-amino-6-(5-phosphoribosylamino)uracil reductase RibD [Candidatus Latescibacterota bacterium]|nr:MAG: bifunctional diaminohydroxyphosphoribosylaminopyrimidine deaminase/5-amino-6-(5-phosphoribosylamino)uracil reductase RibD [Candidatus Latescibacterota bacterium]
MSFSDSVVQRPEPTPAGDLMRQYTIDDYFLDRAIDLAWLGAGRTHPNPLVGAIVVNDGHIVSVGYHQRYGEAHAETIALERAGEAARGSTLYVTLEPCAHHGNTPPCVETVLKSGVRRVVIPTLDPDDRVYGRGVAILRDDGVDVDVGRRCERAMLLNLAYFKRVLGLGVAVTLKMAVTLDGRIASRAGSRDQITGTDSLRFVHRLRAVNDAVLVGINTVVVDSPRLDCRLIDTEATPVAVVLDSRLRFPETSPMQAGDRTVVVVTAETADEDSVVALRQSGVRVVKCGSDGGRVDVKAAVAELAAQGIASCLVEGGGEVFSSFTQARLWDGMHVFVSPMTFGNEGVALSEQAFDRSQIGAVHAGASAGAGDVLMSFVNEKTRDTLLKHLL